MRALVLIAAFLVAAPVFAQTWEYRVVNLPTYVDGKTPPGVKEGAFAELEMGGYVDNAVTRALNELAKEGWEPVNLTTTMGMTSWGHFVLLRRPLNAAD